MRYTANKKQHHKNAIKNYNYASLLLQQRQQINQKQSQQQQINQTQQQIIKNNSSKNRRKSRKKYKTKRKTTTALATSLSPTSTSSLSSSSSSFTKCNYSNNKLLIALLLLITMTATTTTICQTTALEVKTSPPPTATERIITTTTTSPPSAAAASAAASLLSPTQQRQTRQQQQHLFALLTKNRQTSGHHLQQQQQQQQRQQQHYDDLNDQQHFDNINTSIETSGFIADDGQQYEKAEQSRLTAAAAIAAAIPAADDAAAGGATTALGGGAADAAAGVVNTANCPKECKCLNDFFDCGKKQLDRVPELPSYVQNIDLVGNKLNDSTVLQITNLFELVKLSLKRNQLDTVPKFIGLNSLKQLNLANNRIQRISSDALAALPKLKALDLSRNILHTVDVSYFPKSIHLAHLILSSNEIASVTENAFETMTDLIELDLSSNRLTTLPAGVFRNLGKLKKLSLNYNHLEINWSTFKGLTALQKLLLKSNNIRSLQDGVFHVMRAIESIELDHNSITSLGRQGLFNLTKLHHLSLSNNSINRIELDTWEFTQSLITLDLSHNNISEFKPQHLDCLQRLRHLNLGHNKINFLFENTFDCVKNLEDLNLRRNKLAWIIEDQSAAPPFKALKKLKKLDLYGNNLKQINTKSLNGLVSLETLNLGGNSLASIQSGAFEHMPHLQKVNFKSINFICDCELLWFRRWVQRTQPSQNSGNAVCGYPEQLFDRKVVSLTQAELVCAETPKPVITQEPSNQLAVKGANITMECIAISPAAASLAAADELKIKWRHDNQHVRERVPGSHPSNFPAATTETQIHHNQETNQTTIIGYLRLYNVSYDSAGKYQCVVTNAFGTTYSQKFKMSIGIHPSFLEIPSNLTIDSGDTARLVCSATGDPMPEIALQKFGASDFPAATERRLKVVREENAFIITNAKPIDTGIYTCTAESAAGEIKINASLVVNDKPLPVIPLVRKEILLTQPSVLECLNSDGAAADDVQPTHRRREWFKDNKPFHTSATSASDRYYFTAAKELLVIVNTQSIDAGHYRCDINDDAKTYTIQMDLVVMTTDDNFNQNVLIVGLAVVTATCVLIGSCIVWLVLFMQKGKLRFGSISPQRVRQHAASANTLNGSRAGTLDHTQLSTLNRSYLLPQQQQHRYHGQAATPQQRPRSAGSAEIEAEQRKSLMAAAAAAAAASGGCSATQQYAEDGIGITLEYLTRGDMELLDHHHNQDHLSSKDSGTGSDAAAKRSIDDFTLTLLPADDVHLQQQPHQMHQSQQLEQQNLVVSTPVLKKRSNADDESQFMELNALGVSEYGGGRESGPSPVLNGGYKVVNGSGGRVLKHHNINNNSNHNRRTKSGQSGSGSGSESSSSDSSGDGRERETNGRRTAAGKTNLSTNFYAVGKRQYAAVDI